MNIILAPNYTHIPNINEIQDLSFETFVTEVAVIKSSLGFKFTIK